MNRLLTALVCPPVLAVAMYMALFAPVERSWAGGPSAGAATGVPEPPPGAAVFEMKYRGLTRLDDPLIQGSFSGPKRQDDPNGPKDPFVLAVRSQVKESTLVRNDRLPRAQWAVLELKDQKPVAFYFDVNADAKLSDDEKFLPVPPLDLKLFGFSCAFITSDFIIRTPDQREIPFRYVLVGISSNVPYYWGPFCVLEGQASLAGEPTKLVLYPDKLDGDSFTTFGSSSYALIPTGPKGEGHPARYPLSSLIEYKGIFYRLKMDGVHEKGKTVRVSLEKDTRPTGSWAVALGGKEALKVRVERATINGARDNTVYFDWLDTRSPLPAGRYRLSSVSVTYGVQKDNDWKATIQGPEFEVDAGKIRQVDLGGLVLSVRAMDENDRNRRDAKERSVFAQGTSIYLAPQIQGKAGEVYTRFYGKNPQNDFADVNAHITILDANGKPVASADIPYT